MSYFLWFFILSGIAALIGFLIIFVVFIGMVIFAFFLAIYNTIKYKTWTEQGKARYKHDHGV